MKPRWVCRIVGWLYAALGAAGTLSRDIGAYFRFTPVEAYLYLALGVWAVWAARRRTRTSVLALLCIGILSFAWSLSPWMGLPQAVLRTMGSQQPLDLLIRELVAIWGIGTAVKAVLDWRSSHRSTTS
ncbi:hypothetical protein [Alicyclobacillus mali (ex Roth et al. 2021)]|uniref:hypothetical protein n=1 Tax=Alicyclobacillus mali (ex Roth et al. 2021) TaxID=1123961 RepID=UPI001A8D78A0|nr:hypothetical protein [Alicyclobacillus mali (ex Roth et al. 2021)]